ncbi:hypothetical protein [Sphingomonas endolithica]|uniref:hypothetical protein n=1 Tax=Sphingomonas endolithica TaxID=2972485 RepID=UPI0021AF0301|nr:hypothetical protein [Sphingomonas sp. ZFBP2030]
MIDETSNLWADGLAFIQAHGDDWPNAAIAHARWLVAEGKHQALPRWLRVVKIMQAVHQRRIEH